MAEEDADDALVGARLQPGAGRTRAGGDDNSSTPVAQVSGRSVTAQVVLVLPANAFQPSSTSSSKI
jgi:hypothetical protein